MAKNDDPWRRLRGREDEEEREKAAGNEPATLREKRASAGVQAPAKVVKENDTAKLDLLMDTGRSLIEQINNLYSLYINGVERLPPIEKRNQLTALVNTIMASHKPTQAVQFKCASFQSTFNTHRDRWDRLMRDLEAGKIKRAL